jgi:hypothetical protein
MRKLYATSVDALVEVRVDVVIDTSVRRLYDTYSFR